ncbi:ribosomal RNA small subunit methyltransferase A [Candidatus Uhrbacteria bacterium CG10_big_fil_rev_8_21_14_0_10_48_11]|uniref:Ribosomal RNA small subunit methyltransferase A n=1 Tax=Candidatus Uhrbacteria bacterium CG10_big_fil_rev_8_21_14_0_10_48_11 TaxID=1975037 RepID=A0A2M8LFQ9_9BACT|nr:MAG: ribosomal RNA small subunit methyltransferase A [Candidatus Uhrbacteria bacterium CG10_big_fil_rev_8_21_14_0_10_48_11]
MSKSQTTITALLKEYQLSANARRSQNFLIDDQVYDDIVEVAQLTTSTTVLEVGAGLGTLTERLAVAAGQVVTIEIDDALVGVLRKRFDTASNVQVVHADVLAGPVTKFGIVLPYVVVANIPYHITASILRKFLVDDLSPATMTLLVQREVGERIVAKPGDLSMLGISVQLYAEPRIVRIVSRLSFLPAPAVDSVLLQIDNVHLFPFGDVEEKFFWRVVKVGFAQKRKQLRNNLAAAFPLPQAEMVALFKKIGINEKARAQELSIEAWHQLALNFGRIA